MVEEQMTHLDLFSGIGGFSLAARWMGWETVGFVEIDPFCQKVLKKNFPNVPIYGDIKQFNGTEWAGKIDVLTGGFPCQPFSNAGKRKGKEDDRYLWPEMLRVIGEIGPRFIVGENVSGSWQLVDQICTELENLGYETQPTGIEAASIGANHRRFRYWFIAQSEGISCNSTIPKHKTRAQEISCGRPDKFRAITNANTERLQRSEKTGITNCEEQRAGKFPARLLQSAWQNFPTQSPICGGNDGIPNRVDRIKSLGNAIVPQVAFEIFKAISSTMK